MVMNVVISSDNKYAKYACVQLTSLLVNQHDDNEVNIYILNSQLSDDNMERLQKLQELHKKSSITFVNVNKDDFSEVASYVRDWTIEAYYRLQACELLPASVDKYLYLDIDTIVNKPLDELFGYDIPDDIDVIGALDGDQPMFGDSRDAIFAKWIDAGTLTYICSGVTLWNLKAYRGRVELQNYLDVASMINYSMTSPDQDLINYVHQGRIGVWGDDISYGAYAKGLHNKGCNYIDVSDKTYIIHYAGQKPWQGQFVHYDIEKIWWDYAKRTEIYELLMEEFIEAVLMNPLVYNTLKQSMDDKKSLQLELNKSIELNKKMLNLLQKS